MNVKMKRQIQHLWFIKELLRKILTIAVAKMFFSENVTIWVENFIGSVLNHPAVWLWIEFSAEIVVKCEMKQFLWRSIPIKAFTLKAIVKIYIQLCSFSKSRDIIQKFWVSETTHKKSLQKHLESEIYLRGNAYHPAFSCFTGWNCPGIFFIQTHTLIVKLQSFQFLNPSAVPLYTL